MTNQMKRFKTERLLTNNLIAECKQRKEEQQKEKEEAGD